MSQYARDGGYAGASEGNHGEVGSTHLAEVGVRSVEGRGSQAGSQDVADSQSRVAVEDATCLGNMRVMELLLKLVKGRI